MTRIDEKLGKCERLLKKLGQLEQRRDAIDFGDEFGNLLNTIGSIRQYVQEELATSIKSSPAPTREQIWLDELERDVDVATIVGLRDTDYHEDAITVKRQGVVLTGHAVVSTTASFSARIIRDDGTPEEWRHSDSEPARPLPSQESPTATYVYHLEPTALPPGFMTHQHNSKAFGRISGQRVRVAAGEAMPMKEAVIDHLRSHDLGGIAKRAVNRIRADISLARDQGFLS